MRRDERKGNGMGNGIGNGVWIRDLLHTTPLLIRLCVTSCFLSFEPFNRVHG